MGWSLDVIVAPLDSISWDPEDPERNDVKISIKFVYAGFKILQNILPYLVVNTFYFQRYATQIIKNKYGLSKFLE